MGGEGYGLESTRIYPMGEDINMPVAFSALIQRHEEIIMWGGVKVCFLIQKFLIQAILASIPVDGFSRL